MGIAWRNKEDLSKAKGYYDQDLTIQQRPLELIL
ncbi:MAG: hypothetical protein KTR25_04155 [Myxococcales bacterium]|nr:hypothetical protein [Myxococcales bacterium]